MQDLPTVLVEVEGTPLVDMPFSGLEGSVDHPDPVQLVAEVVRVDVQWRQDVLVLEGVAVQLVAVIGDVYLLLADQLPVVAVRATIEHFEVVGGA